MKKLEYEISECGRDEIHTEKFETSRREIPSRPLELTTLPVAELNQKLVIFEFLLDQNIITHPNSLAVSYADFLQQYKNLSEKEFYLIH